MRPYGIALTSLPKLRGRCDISIVDARFRFERGDTNVVTREASVRTRESVLTEGLHPGELAFFLDVDGTLLEIAPTPAQVVVTTDLMKLLQLLLLRSNGAVAFVSGRNIGTLDDLFSPLLLPAAGLHGFERRDATGTYMRRALPSGIYLFEARRSLQRLLDEHPQLLLEDKRYALAIHYRMSPELAPVVHAAVRAVITSLGPEFEMQHGRCVVEIRPASANKGLAVAEFMQEAPFRGRRPLCLGDDLTDDCAFEWVNAAGGLSIAVGVQRPSAAQAHLGSVRAAKMWLHRLLEAGA
jgi:trehalose 6-phosphate phosphatase